MTSVSVCNGVTFFAGACFMCRSNFMREDERYLGSGHRIRVGQLRAADCTVGNAALLMEN